MKKLFMILLGNFILAFGKLLYAYPNGDHYRRSHGIGLTIHKFTGISLSYAVWVLNCILFFMGLFFMGKAFAMSIILSTFLSFMSEFGARSPGLCI